MTIESSNFCFNNNDRGRKEAELARQNATYVHLAHLVIARNGERLIHIAGMGGIDLKSDEARQEILTRVATIREDLVRDYDIDYCAAIDESSDL